jgi:hypothetical protein
MRVTVNARFQISVESVLNAEKLTGGTCAYLENVTVDGLTPIWLIIFIAVSFRDSRKMGFSRMVICSFKLLV